MLFSHIIFRWLITSASLFSSETQDYASQSVGAGTNASHVLLCTTAWPQLLRFEMLSIPRVRRRRKMTALARARRRIQGVGPYLSLVLLLAPLLLVEPLKLIALFVAGSGHWLTGTGMIIGAYAVSLLFVERLFKVVKPKLMMLGWFASLWTWFVTLRNKVISSLRGKPLTGDQPR
jgi:hypothetical protein